MYEKLLSCPFCGGEAETFEASEDSFSILCTGCGVETPYLPYLTEAIAAWNRRADAVPVVRGEWEVAIGYDPNKKVQCQNCYKMAYEPTPYCPNCGAKMEANQDE